MFLRPHHREKDGKRHSYWSLVETVRTVDGPRQRTLCHLGELNGSAQARWLKTIEVFNDAGERHQLKLFPSDVAPPADDAEVAVKWVLPARAVSSCLGTDIMLARWRGEEAANMAYRPTALLKPSITRVKFIEAMVSNGRLEVLNAATRERLGRTDPCIPVNIDPAGTMENLAASLVRLKEERERRSKTPNASGSEATSS